MQEQDALSFLVQDRELTGAGDGMEALNLWVNFLPWGGENFRLMIATIGYEETKKCLLKSHTTEMVGCFG